MTGQAPGVGVEVCREAWAWASFARPRPETARRCGRLHTLAEVNRGCAVGRSEWSGQERKGSMVSFQIMFCTPILFLKIPSAV
jgi:hypothetical protein